MLSSSVNAQEVQQDWNALLDALQWVMNKSWEQVVELLNSDNVLSFVNEGCEQKIDGNNDIQRPWNDNTLYGHIIQECFRNSEAWKELLNILPLLLWNFSDDTNVSNAWVARFIDFMNSNPNIFIQFIADIKAIAQNWLSYYEPGVSDRGFTGHRFSENYNKFNDSAFNLAYYLDKAWLTDEEIQSYAEAF